MKTIFVSLVAVAGVLGAILAGGSGAILASGDDDSGRRVEVTITNLTRGQILSPAVVVTHTRRQPALFSAGASASDELRQVAEDAVNGPLLDLLEASSEVGDVGALAGPVLPGQSSSIVLEARGGAKLVSVVGMLVTTNDAFFGVSGIRVSGGKARMVRSPAYDAGTEENNELCAYIPGPPCGQALMRAGGGEGFVHVHAGVHGIGDLDASEHDWRNPVASIRIRRVR